MINWYNAPAKATHVVDGFNGPMWLRLHNGRWQRWDRVTKRWAYYCPLSKPIERPQV